MRQLVFVISGLVLCYSCQNSNDKEKDHADKEKIMLTDSLPDAEWNGEYMKVKDDEDDEKDKRSTRSMGSKYYKIGEVNLQIGNHELKFINFLGNRNVLSFTKNSIKAIITNDQNEQIELHLKKEGILSNFKGTYKGSVQGTSNASLTMMVTIEKGGGKKKYNLQSGTGKLIEFSPRNGKFEMDLEGVFTDKSDKKYNGDAEIKIQFENVAMVPS